MHLRWTGLGLEANTVAEYVLRAALLHVRHPWAPALLTFMAIQFFHLMFGESEASP